MQNVARDEYVYPNNSDDSDFEDSFRTIPDDTSEVFDPPPAVPSDVESETESVIPNESDENGDEPNSYGLQQTPIYNFRMMPKMKKISRMDGTGLIYLKNRIQNLR